MYINPRFTYIPNISAYNWFCIFSEKKLDPNPKYVLKCVFEFFQRIPLFCTFANNQNFPFEVGTFLCFGLDVLPEIKKKT